MYVREPPKGQKHINSSFLVVSQGKGIGSLLFTTQYRVRFFSELILFSLVTTFILQRAEHGESPSLFQNEQEVTCIAFVAARPRRHSYLQCNDYFELSSDMCCGKTLETFVFSQECDVYDIFVHVNIYLGLGNSHLHFLK